MPVIYQVFIWNHKIKIMSLCPCRCVSLKPAATVTAPWWSCQRAARQLSPDRAREGPCRSASMRSSAPWAREILQWWNSLDTKSLKRRSAACLLVAWLHFNAPPPTLLQFDMNSLYIAFAGGNQDHWQDQTQLFQPGENLQRGSDHETAEPPPHHQTLPGVCSLSSPCSGATGHVISVHSCRIVCVSGLVGGGGCLERSQPGLCRLCVQEGSMTQCLIPTAACRAV